MITIFPNHISKTQQLCLPVLPSISSSRSKRLARMRRATVNGCANERSVALESARACSLRMMPRSPLILILLIIGATLAIRLAWCLSAGRPCHPPSLDCDSWRCVRHGRGGLLTLPMRIAIMNDNGHRYLPKTQHVPSPWFGHRMR